MRTICNTFGKYFLLLVATFTLAYSCTPEIDEEKKLDINQDILNFMSQGEEKIIEISSNVDWSIVVPTQGASWVSLDVYTGVNNGVVKITTAANQTSKARSVTLTINSTQDVEPLELVITQEVDAIAKGIEFIDPIFKELLLAESFGDIEAENYQGHIPQKIDANGDGEISVDEAEDVIQIGIYNTEVSDMTEIKYFTALEKLICSINSNLAELDLSANIKLKHAYLVSNALKKLDVSYNSDLEYLSCSYNDLTELDLSSNHKLVHLGVNENALTVLDVSNNPLLQQLHCAYNDYISALDVTGLTELRDINFSSNQITSIDLTNNTKLNSIYGQYNLLTELDVTKNTEIYRLTVDSNKLTEIDLSKNKKLSVVDLHWNNLVTIDLTQNEELIWLNAHNNATIESITFGNNSKLYHIGVDGNAITELDVSGLSGLKRLVCYDNRLSELDVTKNDALITDPEVKGVTCGEQKDASGNDINLALKLTVDQVAFGVFDNTNIHNKNVTVTIEGTQAKNEFKISEMPTDGSEIEDNTWIITDNTALSTEDFANLRAALASVELGRLITLQFPYIPSFPDYAIGDGVNWESVPAVLSVSAPLAKSIGEYAFYGCTSVYSFDFPLVESIALGAFNGCAALRSISLESASVLESDVFRNCKLLSSVELPKVTSLGSMVFGWCDNLTTLTLATNSRILALDKAAFTGGSINLSNIDLTTGKNNGTQNDGSYLYFEDQKIGPFKSVTGGDVKEVGTEFTLANVPTDGSTITGDLWVITDSGDPASGDFANLFSALTSAGEGRLISLEFPNINSFPYGALSNVNDWSANENVYSVKAPNATTIGSYAFYALSNATNFELKSATKLEAGAFNACTSLTYIKLEKASELASDVFRNCKGLVSAELPSVTSIGQFAFGWCDNITTLKLATESQVSSMNSDAFAGGSVNAIKIDLTTGSNNGTIVDGNNWTAGGATFTFKSITVE